MKGNTQMESASSDLKFLQELSEKELCELVIIPLLRAMEYKNIRYLHGRDEYGKDIVFTRKDPLEEQQHFAAAVKRTKLSGSVSSSNSIHILYTQIKQALKLPFLDPSTGKEVRIAKVFIFTPFNISQECIRSIRGELLEYSENCIQFIDGSLILDHLQSHLPTLLRSLPTPESRYLYFICQKFLDAPLLASMEGAGERGLLDVYTGGEISEIKPEQGRLLSFASPENYTNKKKLRKALDENPFMVVLADVGTGKTTLLYKFILEIGGYGGKKIDDKFSKTIPLIIPLASISAEAFSSYKTIRDSILSRIRHDLTSESFNFENAQNYILLLDGFDEISVDRSDVSQFHELERCLNLLAGTSLAGIVITSRPTRIPELSSRFNYYALNPFGEDQIVEFLKKWFYDNPGRADDIADKIKSSSELKLFCRTPLILTIYAILARRFSLDELPTRRSAIYERMVELFLGRWDNAREIVNQFDAELKTHVLEHLSYTNHERRSRHFYRVSFDDAARNVLRRKSNIHVDFMHPNVDRDQVEALFDEIYYRSALIRDAQGKTKTNKQSEFGIMSEYQEYEFVHLSFQEFLCARRLARLGRAQSVEQLKDDWWRNTYRFYFGITGTMDGAAFPLKGKKHAGLGLVYLEYLGEAEFTTQATRSNIYALMGKDLLYSKNLTKEQLEVCARVGDELIDPLHRIATERDFWGNGLNFFRILLELNTTKSRRCILDCESVLANMQSHELIQLLEELGDFVEDTEERDLIIKVLHVLAEKHHYRGKTQNEIIKERKAMQSKLNAFKQFFEEQLKTKRRITDNDRTLFSDTLDRAIESF